MLNWVIVAGLGGAIAPPEIVRRVGGADHDALPFLPDEHLSWSNDAGTIHLAAWQAFGEIAGLGSRWHDVDGRLALCSGFFWPRRTGWSGPGSIGQQFHRWLERNDPVADDELLHGLWTAVQLDRRGGGRAMADPFTALGIFTASTANAFVASNRAALVAAAVTPEGESPARDAFTVGQTVYSAQGAPVLEGTGFSGVMPIPQGSWIEFAPGGPVIHPPDRSIMELPPGRPGLSIDEAARIIRDDLGDALQGIAAIPFAGRELRLSGGKDSRLILALIGDEGLQDRFSLLTFGSGESRDVTVAREAARIAGMPITVQDRTTHLTPEEVDRDLRSHAFNVSGALGPWDAKATRPVDGVARLLGSGSELIRPVYVARLSRGSVDNALHALAAGPLRDRNRMLRPEVRAWYTEEVTRLVHDLARRGVDPTVMGPGVNIAMYAIRNFFGASQATDGSPWLNPFISIRTFRAALASDPNGLANETWAFLLMRQMNPDLAALPYANSSWTPELLETVPDAGPYIGIPEWSGPAEKHGDWRVLGWRRNQPVISRYLRDHSNPIWQVIDMQRFGKLMVRRQVTAMDLRQIYSVIGGAIWLGGHDERIPITRP